MATQKVITLKRFTVKLSILVISSFCIFACGGNGTEISNPKRSLTGIFGESIPTLKLATSNESCPSANGDISISLVPKIGTSISTTVSHGESFSTDLNQNDRYEVQFLQNNAVCGHLSYPDGERLDGLRVIVGKGSENIDLGHVSDLGNGVFVSDNDPSSHCDDDGDGTSDALDDDINGDGLDDTDLNFDGYFDWYEEDSGGDNSGNDSSSGSDDGDSGSDDGSDSGSSSSCELAYIDPSSASGLELDGDSVGEITLNFNGSIGSFDSSLIKILDADGNTVIDGIDENAVAFSGDDSEVRLEVDLDYDTDYTFQIPQAAMTCPDASAATSGDVEIDFFTLPQDD